MTSSKKLLIGIFVFALSAGLAFTQEDEPSEVKEVDISDSPPVAEAACFNVRDVRNFDAIRDRYVYVEGRRGEHYLLTMFTQCFGLRSALGIAISNDFNRVCSNSSATITYREFGQLESCRIRAVESVEDKAAAEQIVELRRRSD